MTTESPTGIPVMDPRGVTPTASVSMAPRPSELGGKTIGFVDNAKINAGSLLDKLSTLVQAEVELARIVRFSKTDATRPAPPALIAQIADECDVAVLAIGD